MPSSISTVLLYVSDIVKSARFYEDTLGFEKMHAGNDVAEFRLGDATLLLHHDKNFPPGKLPPVGERGGGVKVYFTVENVDRFCDELKENGVAILEEPADQPYGLRTMELADPDGYRLLFCHTIPTTHSH